MTTAKTTIPTKSLLQGMTYVTAVKTDIRELFARIVAQQQKKRKHDSVSKVKA